jgi:CDP-glycerol glycerophosphotransferase
MPVVSVVVIAYNDARNLPAALRSAQEQTLRDVEIVVVDDGSTDDTPRVIAAAAAGDPRVRPMRLADNSGGCSRPRNTGLGAATGDYVLFLDSDDVLARRSLERLYAGARRADADIACGRMLRRHHHPRRYLPANDDLYRRATVLQGVLSRPAQLRDTPACGKLFRREFLESESLRFPEGLLFEDLLFTTTAYAAAGRIAIVPHLSYVWNVRRDQAVPSITNRRELRNWRDRFDIHRRIDADLAGRPRAVELRAAKDRKFLTVDWPIFLRDLRAFPPSRRGELLDVAAAYVAGLPAPALADVAPGLRVACHLAGRGELAATLTAADYVTTGGIAADLAVDDGRLYWSGAHASDDAARQALDVTSLGLLTAPFGDTPFLAVVSRAGVTGGVLELTGVVADLLGRLAAGPVAATVRVSGRFGGRVATAPAALQPHGQGVEFRTSIDLEALARRVHPGVGHELRLDLLVRRGSQVARVPLTARDAQLPEQPVALAGRWHRVVGDSARLVERNGRLVLDLWQLHPVAEAAMDLASRARGALGRLGTSRPGWGRLGSRR